MFDFWVVQEDKNTVPAESLSSTYTFYFVVAVMIASSTIQR